MDYNNMSLDSLACYVVKLARECSDGIKQGYDIDDTLVELERAKRILRQRAKQELYKH